MSWVDHYLTARYEDGARGECRNGVYFYDCWGLAREVRHVHLGKRLLPSWGHVRNTNPREFTRAYRGEADLMEECEPEPGALVCVFRGVLCIHVAVIIEVDQRLAVLEINQRSGPRWTWFARWADEHLYTKVKYYRDRSLPQQATRSPN